MTRRKRPSRGPERSRIPGAITRGGRKFIWSVLDDAFIEVRPTDTDGTAKMAKPDPEPRRLDRRHLTRRQLEALYDAEDDD